MGEMEKRNIIVPVGVWLEFRIFSFGAHVQRFCPILVIDLLIVSTNRQLPSEIGVLRLVQWGCVFDAAC